MNTLTRCLKHIEERTELVLALCVLLPLIHAFTIFPTDILMAMLISFVTLRQGAQRSGILLLVYSLAKVALIYQGLASPVALGLVFLVVGLPPELKMEPSSICAIPEQNWLWVE